MLAWVKSGGYKETRINLTDVKDFAVTDKALFKILLHGSPQYVIRLRTEDE